MEMFDQINMLVPAQLTKPCCCPQHTPQSLIWDYFLSDIIICVSVDCPKPYSFAQPLTWSFWPLQYVNPTEHFQPPTPSPHPLAASPSVLSASSGAVLQNPSFWRGAGVFIHACNSYLSFSHVSGTALGTVYAAGNKATQRPGGVCDLVGETDN